MATPIPFLIFSLFFYFLFLQVREICVCILTLPSRGLTKDIHYNNGPAYPPSTFLGRVLKARETYTLYLIFLNTVFC